MWIRDSTWQVLPLLEMNPSLELCEIIGAVSQRQAHFLHIDPYANAFNESENGKCWHKDFPDQSDWVFERKFELDSWTAYLELALSLYEQTGYSRHLDERFWEVVATIVQLCVQEQRHDKSTYQFVRTDSPEWDQLPNGGFGSDMGYTGLVWSAFRPSDDRCAYGYHIPSNAHLSVVLKRLNVVAETFGYQTLLPSMTTLVNDLNRALSELVTTQEVLPYEIDGLGNAVWMDDPNIPSLLSLPFLGWCLNADPIYIRTRSWIHSPRHSHFVADGDVAGIASEHTPPKFVWPLSIAMRGLTTDEQSERQDCLRILVGSDGGTGDMHESFNISDPRQFTRHWFSWADMLFVQLVIRTRCNWR